MNYYYIQHQFINDGITIAARVVYTLRLRKKHSIKIQVPRARIQTHTYIPREIQTYFTLHISHAKMYTIKRKNND